MTRPRVSVVVPPYNNAKYIEETMRSILSQTLRDMEVIVSDHSSTDGTWGKLQRFTADGRVQLLQIPRGGGAERNWQHVTSLATGEFVKLVCGDDLLYPTALEEQVAALDRHPSAVLVASQRDLIDAVGKPVLRGRGLARLNGLVEGRKAARATVLAGANVFGEPVCVLFRRDVLQRMGGWDGRWPYVIDEATYVRCLLAGDVVALRRTLGGFRMNHAQLSVKLARQQSQQVVAFHHALASATPGLLSRADLLIGDNGARGMALLRRLVYVSLRRRMRVDEP